MHYYTIDEGKLLDVIRAYKTMEAKGFAPPATAEQLEAAILGDWQEGDEHQEWIDTATAADIADWLSYMTFEENETND